jgi:Ras family protein A
MAKKIQAKYYFETSAMSRLCVHETFEYTTRAAMRYVETGHAKKKKRDSCIVM